MTGDSQVHALPAVRVVTMVAGREISTRVRSRAFLISNAIILSVIAGGLILTSVLQGSIGEPPTIGLVGSAEVLTSPLKTAGTALGTKVTTRELESEVEARALLADGDIKVALVPRAVGYTALTQKAISPAVKGVVTTAVQQLAVTNGLKKRGVNPSELALEVNAASVTIEQVKKPKKDADQRTALAFAAVGLLYLQLATTGVAVASSVVEEKTSRVVELLLATIKPLHLLVGKVIGIGIVGLVQLAGYAVAALTVGGLTGLVSLSSSAAAVFAGTLGWYVLGFAFLGVLYAAAGSLVSRQEDVGSTTSPLSFLVIAMFVVAQTSVQDPDGTMASVMSWIPPFSAVLMPLRIAAGVTGPAQIIGTVALMLLATSVFAVLAAKVYQRSILRIGSRVSWKQALGRG
jgi:ABC-2 type transport system permease protein